MPYEAEYSIHTTHISGKPKPVCRKCLNDHVSRYGWEYVATTFAIMKRLVAENVHECACGRYIPHSLTRDAVERVRIEIENNEWRGIESALREAYTQLNIRNCSNCGAAYATRCRCRREEDLPVFEWEHDCKAI